MSPVRGAIFPGVVQLIERGIWDAEVESLSLSTRTICSCSQKVRQWTLTPRFVGSNPATSAILMKDSYSKYLIGLLTKFNGYRFESCRTISVVCGVKESMFS